MADDPTLIAQTTIFGDSLLWEIPSFISIYPLVHKKEFVGRLGVGEDLRDRLHAWYQDGTPRDIAIEASDDAYSIYDAVPTSYHCTDREDGYFVFLKLRFSRIERDT